MGSAVKIAHISDIHLGPLPPFALEHWNVKRALGYLNWQRGRRHVHTRAALDLISADMVSFAPDHIAVTGDLVNIALPREYDAALGWLEGLGPPDRVSVIPGNHDIYTPMGGDPGVGRWAAYMQSDAYGLSVAAHGGDERPAAGDSGGRFPYVRRIGPVAIVGLNSAILTPPFVASGALGTHQLGRLPPILDKIGRDGLARVVLIHHPPLVGQATPIRGLKDAAELERVLIAHGAELVLHGHNHRDMLVWRHGKKGRFPVIGIATGSAHRSHHGEPPARYNLIEIKPVEGGFRLTRRLRGIGAEGGIVDLEHRVLGGSPELDTAGLRTAET